MNQDFIIDVSEQDFDFQVLSYSEHVPVVVDFWAEWCVPCKMLSQTLETLAQEAMGSFRLARVNVDQNQNLAYRFNIRSIPAVKAFRDGKIAAEFMGALPEARIRQFIQTISPNQIDLLLEKAYSLLHSQPELAEKEFRQILSTAPATTTALLGFAKSVLLQGFGEEALAILTDFPASSEYSAAENIRPLAAALASLDDTQDFEDQPLDAAYHHSLQLIRRGNLEAAMDGMLDILRQDKRYGNGAPRQMMVALFELLGDEDPLTRQYRQELSLVLF